MSIGGGFMTNGTIFGLTIVCAVLGVLTNVYTETEGKTSGLKEYLKIKTSQVPKSHLEGGMAMYHC